MVFPLMGAESWIQYESHSKIGAHFYIGTYVYIYFVCIDIDNKFSKHQIISPLPVGAYLL